MITEKIFNWLLLSWTLGLWIKFFAILFHLAWVAVRLAQDFLAAPSPLGQSGPNLQKGNMRDA